MCWLLLLAGAAGAWADGTIDMSSPAGGEGWTVENGVVVRIREVGNYVVKGSSSLYRVEVMSGIRARVVLEDVSIRSAVASPFSLGEGARVTLNLIGENTLASISTDTAGGYAGLQMEGEDTQVTIDGEGSLIAQGGARGAGIGSGRVVGQAKGDNAGMIVINSGSITSTGGERGAGIGGGSGCDGGTIIINGGFVRATGSFHAAGIGGGESGNGGNISINGGVVLAIHSGGVGDPAAIGGGWRGLAGTVRINGGAVCAYSGTGTGIGNGTGGGNGGTIEIDGGLVVANRIGVGLRAWDGAWHAGVLTPTRIDGSLTTVITDTTATVNFGNAKVTIGTGISESFVRTMALTEASKIVYVHVPVWTNEYDTITRTERDTVIQEVHGPTVTIYDTILQIIQETVRDTVFADHHDTLTLWDTLTVHDTLRIELHDTFSYVALDTAYIEMPTADMTYIVVDTYAGTESEVKDELHAIYYGEGDLYWLGGGLEEGEFVIYDLNGHIVLRATSVPVQLTISGTFIVGQNGKYFKLVK